MSSKIRIFLEDFIDFLGKIPKSRRLVAGHLHPYLENTKIVQENIICSENRLKKKIQYLSSLGQEFAAMLRERKLKR